MSWNRINTSWAADKFSRIAQSSNIVNINKACSSIDKMCQYGMWEVAGNSYVSICNYTLQLCAKLLGNYSTENDTNNVWA